MMPDVEVVSGDTSPEENEGAGDTKEPEATPVTAEDANVAETKIMKTQKDLEEAIRAYEEKYINSPAGQAEESIAPDPAEEITEPDGEEENVASQSTEEIVVSPAEEDMMPSGEEETVIASSGKEETVSPETYDTISDAEEDDEDDDDDLIIPEEELTIEGPWIGVEEENDTDTAPEDTDGNAGDTVILEPVKTSEENEAPDVTEIKDEFGDLEEALTRQLQSETEKDRPSADNDEIWKINEKDGFITDAPDGEETDAPDEGPQEFLPVERMTLDDLYEQVKKEKQRPTIERDDATGITVFDYTELV